MKSVALRIIITLAAFMLVWATFAALYLTFWLLRRMLIGPDG
jgi:hypothetical protein